MNCTLPMRMPCTIVLSTDDTTTSSLLCRRYYLAGEGCYNMQTSYDSHSGSLQQMPDTCTNWQQVLH
jgi:hypothetical protein